MRCLIVAAAVLAIAGCGRHGGGSPSGEGQTAALDLALDGSPGFPGKSVYICASRLASVDPKYPCLNEACGCFELRSQDAVADPARFEDLCPSVDVPAADWTFEYTVYSDVACGGSVVTSPDHPYDHQFTCYDSADLVSQAHPNVSTETLAPGANRNELICLSTAPSCDLGDASLAYNDMPFGVVDCAKPTLGFEANGVREFGDEVQLAATGTELDRLDVLFVSYACQSGNWSAGNCESAPGATFTHGLTGNVYAVSDCGGVPCPGTRLATWTQEYTLPYRPSADPVSCTGAEYGQWLNPASGKCQTSISIVIPFTFPVGIALPDKVIWTVAFNTSTAGYSPIGTAACSSGPGGCPYDSLNVGTKTYPNAPYAGIDVDANGTFLNSSLGATYCDGGVGGTGTLRLDTAATDCWAPYKPLGAIITR